MNAPIQIQEQPTGVTRRKFIKGVIAAGAAVSASSYLFRGASTQLFGQGSLPGAVERLMTLTVNGQQRRVDVMKQETLAMTLRYKLGLTGTKLGCDRSECGACTVLIDDVPHYSCSILTHTVRGKKVVTHRRPRVARRHAAPGAAGGGRRAGLPVRVLHVGLRDVGGRIPENESEPDARTARTWHLRQPLPLRGLQQDPECDDARRRKHAENVGVAETPKYQA